MIYPLEKLVPNAPEKNGLPSAKWVIGHLQAVADNFNVTGDGVDVSSKGAGNLHFRSKAGAGDQSGPFRVRRAGDGLTIDPGAYAFGDGAFQTLSFASGFVPTSGWLAVRVSYRLIFQEIPFANTVLTYITAVTLQNVGIGFYNALAPTYPVFPTAPGAYSTDGLDYIPIAKFTAERVQQLWIGPIRSGCDSSGRLQHLMA